MHSTRLGFGVILVGACCAPLAHPGQARGQGVAFQPTVGVAPDGVAMSAVPAVSADRRYVRLSVNAGFSTVTGFQNVGVPFAVSGLGGGENAGAALGLAGGAGAAAAGGFVGAGGAGLRNVGVAMGMDGPVAGGVMGADPARAAWGLAANGFGGTGSAEASPWEDGRWAPAPRRPKASRSKAATARAGKAPAVPFAPTNSPVSQPAAPKGR